MTNIKINEPFSFNGIVWSFVEESGSIVLKKLRKAGKNKEVNRPDINEVIEFYKSKGFPEALAKQFYEYYEAGNWTDGKGQKVKNWKQKSLSVWMKDDRKEQPKDTTKDKFMF